LTKTKVTLRLPASRASELALVAAAVAGPGAVVWAPVEASPGRWRWQPVAPGDVCASAWSRFTNTDISPKAALLPQTETVFRWRGRSSDLRIIDEPPAEAPVALLGARPCDAAALERLDQALRRGEHADAAYARRREAAVIVAWACERPGAACLCDVCGLSPAYPAGDVLAVPAADAADRQDARNRDPGPDLLVGSLTPKGEQVIAALAASGGLACDAAAFAARASELAARRPVGAAPISGRRDWLGLPCDGEAALTMFGAPGWGELSRACLSCGLCAYVCPTCHCFAISDEPRGAGRGRRVRTWDACQFREFMLAAGGHNPRPTKTERTRQRFLHKLVYHRQAHGSLLCTGCGRCVLACPAGVHVAAAATMLAEAAAQAGAAQAASGEPGAAQPGAAQPAAGEPEGVST
jgi:ferredoxin